MTVNEFAKVTITYADGQKESYPTLVRYAGALAWQLMTSSPMGWPVPVGVVIERPNT